MGSSKFSPKLRSAIANTLALRGNYTQNFPSLGEAFNAWCDDDEMKLCAAIVETRHIAVMLSPQQSANCPTTTTTTCIYPMTPPSIPSSSTPHRQSSLAMAEREGITRMSTQVVRPTISAGANDW